MKSIKERMWEEWEERVRDIRDSLGMPVDAGVVETVVAFNAVGLATEQSCQGHIDRGGAYSWIDVVVEGWEGWLPAEKRNELVLRKAGEIKSLLDEFYGMRSVSYDVMLAAKTLGSWVRVEPLGGEYQHLRGYEERKAKLAVYLVEMRDFGRFLKDVFFGTLKK
ncbi:hypothetical protein A3D85_03585 [Candidatus Amesbacteria bacterium RIFCSPHIGHO2_02_FULL_47_9]|nr:MAG: hypothetical protein A3D85_03585 [Candidatus Amesbacteria bacterium RIFCSPHIGHO2_02_FULL_47_9]